MALAWNTRQLLAATVGEETIGGTPVEFHFLCHRELYDSTIITAGRHHSSAGEWVAVGDHHWYTVAVVTRPVYSVPQELCLSFDCFSKTETIGNATIAGPPIDDVALEFGTLLSLLAREPLLPLGSRRIDGKPVRFDNLMYVSPPTALRPIPPKGINSLELRVILGGLAAATEENSNAILAAARLYHAALTLSVYDHSTAYFSLVSAIECLAGHHLGNKTFDFGDVEKFKKAEAIIEKISSLIASSQLIDALKHEMLSAEYFVWQKFWEFIEAFLPEEFWLQKDELHPELHGESMPAVEKSALRRFLREAYNARSAFAHSGTPFPAHIEIGISNRVSSRAVMERLALWDSARFVPSFIWFERLTHLVLREYLIRIISPELAEKRARRAAEKFRVLGILKGLSGPEKESLERLTRWTVRFVGHAVVGPMAQNREWAVDEASLQTLLSSGIIDGDSQSLDGHSWIRSREIGEAVGEFFFGADENPLIENTVLLP